MIDADEKTPVDKTPTLEMLFKKLDEVGADAKLAVTEAREAKGHAQNTYNLCFELNQRFNGIERRMKLVEVSRSWPGIVAFAALIVAALALLKAW